MSEMFTTEVEKWLTDSWILKYEAILIDSPNLELRVTSAQSPAHFVWKTIGEIAT